MNAIDRINALQARDQNLADLFRLIDEQAIREMHGQSYTVKDIQLLAGKLKRPAAQPEGVEL